MSKSYKIIPWNSTWQAAFTQPERTGNWFVWGNSGNGKTSFVMQLLKELSKFGKALLNSREEGSRKTMAEHIQRYNLHHHRNILITDESMFDMLQRIGKRRGPKFFIIDSVQYTGIDFEFYKSIKEAHPNTLFVWISHAQGKQPAGTTANRIRYDADLKIWIEGFVAHSNGRYNPGGQYVIWEKAAKQYHGDSIVPATNNHQPLTIN